MRALCGVFLLLWAATAAAHPGIGIVVDARGDVFYTDLEQVWKIAPDGTRSVAVPHVHTHELAIDAAGNLYGEHLWYNGERVNTWGYYVWRRDPSGRVVKIIPDAPGFRREYSFVRDGKGNMYFPEREKGEIRKRTPSGAIAVHARAGFRDIRWMAAAEDGTVYVIDLIDVVRIAPDGNVTMLARSLSGPRWLRPMFDAAHALGGIWTDRRRNVYIADQAGGKVKRITPGGTVSEAYDTGALWSPTGGVFAANGDLWVLETSMVNQVRAVRVPAARLK